MSIRSDAWHRLVVYMNDTESKISKELTRQHGMGLTEFRALALLDESPKSELRMQDLATRLHLNQSSVTRLVERLERENFTIRDVCPDDKRGIYTVLTETGRTALLAARNAYESLILEAVSIQSETGKSPFQQLMTDVWKAL
jgi:DNA-binding MarR family transcriptional regulator